MCLQLIWKGKTANSHARMEAAVEDERIIQMHREHTHFQGHETWTELMAYVKTWIQKKRLNLPANAKGIFFYDHAPQHGDDVQEWARFFSPVQVTVMFVPRCMTHAFQPADMAVLKTSAAKAWQRWVEDTMTTATTINDGVDFVAATGNATLKKQMKYNFLLAGLNQLGNTETIVASWEACGIRRAMKLPPRLKHDQTIRTSILYDAYVELADLDVPELDEPQEKIPDEVRGEDVREAPAQAAAKAPAKKPQTAPKAPPAKCGKKPGRPKIPPPPPVTRGAITDWMRPKRPREEVQAPEVQAPEVQIVANFPLQVPLDDSSDGECED